MTDSDAQARAGTYRLGRSEARGTYRDAAAPVVVPAVGVCPVAPLLVPPPVPPDVPDCEPPVPPDVPSPLPELSVPSPGVVSDPLPCVPSPEPPVAGSLVLGVDGESVEVPSLAVPGLDSDPVAACGASSEEVPFSEVSTVVSAEVSSSSVAGAKMGVVLVPRPSPAVRTSITAVQATSATTAEMIENATTLRWVAERSATARAWSRFGAILVPEPALAAAPFRAPCEA